MITVQITSDVWKDITYNKWVYTKAEYIRWIKENVPSHKYEIYDNAKFIFHDCEDAIVFKLKFGV